MVPSSKADLKPEVLPDSEDVEERSIVAGKEVQLFGGFGCLENVTILVRAICFFGVLDGFNVRSLIFCNNSALAIALAAITFICLLAFFRLSTFCYKEIFNCIA